MIILSIGMPRAGSGWYYNLTNDLMLANGAQDARQIRKRYHLQSILTEVNCNIGALTPRRLIAVLAPSLMGNTYVIKVHAGPTRFALQLIDNGLIRPTHIYRDPRDAMLSAMENGQRSIERGRPNAFSSLATFDAALKFMQSYVHITEAWLQCNRVLQVRYEDLLSNYDHETERLIQFLPSENENPEIHRIIEKYRPEKAQPDQKGLHFSHGRIGRFRKRMSQEQQEILAQTLGIYLEHMGYVV
jgi:hypothetical protein